VFEKRFKKTKCRKSNHFHETVSKTVLTNTNTSNCTCKKKSARSNSKCGLKNVAKIKHSHKTVSWNSFNKNKKKTETCTRNNAQHRTAQHRSVTCINDEIQTQLPGSKKYCIIV